ncbi:MAG: ubiquinol oxidase subunit II [Steroidobacteraceae bacterium]
MIISVLRSVVIVAVPASLCGCAETVLSPIGPIGAAERTILVDSLAIMLAIVVPTIVATLVFAWWFRSSNRRARYLPTWVYSGELELLVWSVPALVVLFLGGIAWIGSHELDPATPLKARPLQIEVVSLDWKWLFIYPGQQVASINRMVVPAGVPLHLRVTSASVMNVFFVPGLGSQIYSMSGMATQLHLQADTAGTYHGLSANFSGDGFPDMRFTFEALPARQFEEWIATSRRTGGVLDDAAYRGLLQQSVSPLPYTYQSVEPGLFDRIVRLQLPPGEGPRTGRPRPNTKPIAIH